MILWRRWGRAGAALAAVAAGAVFPGGGGFAGGGGWGVGAAFATSNQPANSTSIPPGVTTGPPNVTLLAQTPWVESGQTFRLRLQISASDPSSDQLIINAYNRLTTRTDFDNAAEGQYNSPASYSTGPLKLSTLTKDPSGGVDVSIPINRAAGSPTSAGGAPEFQAQAGSGVFPVQIGIYNSSGAAEGTAITTFLVYAAGPPSVTSLPRLSVAVVVPVHSDPAVGKSGQLQAVSTGESQRLANLVSALTAYGNVPVSLDATPQTVAALSSGSSTDKSTLSALSALVVGGPDELLGAPFVRVSFGDLSASGLGGEIDQQLGSGTVELSDLLGQAPVRSDYVFDTVPSPAGLNALTGRGVSDVVVPAADLSALPASAATETTFAVPTALTNPGGPQATVFAADTRLTADFVNGDPDVLAANQLLAELSMIQLETPGVQRGVVVLPPSGWVADPTFVSTLLAGLAGHPLLAPVTVSGLFSAVPPVPVERQLVTPQSVPASEPSTSSGGSSGVGGGTTVVPPPISAPAAPSLMGVAATIRADRRAVSGLAAVVPSDKSLAPGFQAQLLTAESTDVTAAQRSALLAAVMKGVQRVIGQISLPGASSITLTSTKSQIPLTIRSSLPFQAQVRLQLTSARLLFQPFSPVGGRCRVLTSGPEVCDLTLRAQNTTLKVPVETRSSGVFPLDVELLSPDGSQLLARASDTVRSTAVSGVGVVLIILAVVSLAIWWVRDLRHGRRARQLVPVPVPIEVEAPDDPVVDAFFAQPPPPVRPDGNASVRDRDRDRERD